MTVEFGCPGCGRAVETEPGETVTCAHCGHEATLREAPEGMLAACLACGCPELGRHRDFSRKLGLFLIAVGAVLCLVFASFLPLLIAAAVDAALYFLLPDVAVCYRCRANHRDFENLKAIPRFELERHEHYRFLKHKEEQQAEKEKGGEKGEG